jgi:hypothetical protein
MPASLVLVLALIGISFAGPLVRLSHAHPLAIAIWRLGFALVVILANLTLLGEPVGATLLAAMLPDIREVPGVATFLGGACILAGVFVTIRSPRRLPGRGDSPTALAGPERD